MTDEQHSEESKPTPEEQAAKYYHEYMAGKRGDVPLSVVKDEVVRKVAQDIEDGDVSDDAKTRATKAFSAVDSDERNRANKQMRSGQTSFDVGELDLIIALAGIEEVEHEDEDGNVTVTPRFSTRDTARCRIGAMGMDEYLRWDHLQDANRRRANDAYDEGKARFAPYLPFFQQGLTVEDVDSRGLLGPNGRAS